jgi:uncharacterized membrane protein
MSHPTNSTSITEIIQRAAIGPFPGQLVIALMLIFYGALLALGIYSFWVSRIKKALPAGHPGRLDMVHREEA